MVVVACRMYLPFSSSPACTCPSPSAIRAPSRISTSLTTQDLNPSLPRYQDGQLPSFASYNPVIAKNHRVSTSLKPLGEASNKLRSDLPSQHTSHDINMAIQVTRMTEADISGAIDTIQQAFASDPYNLWIYPDRSKVRPSHRTFTPILIPPDRSI
jgi:hypothetical protein